MGFLPIESEICIFKGLTENLSILPNEAVKNEQHILDTCSIYSILRNSMNNNVYQRCIDLLNMNNGDKCDQLLTNEWREIVNFIDKPWYMKTQNMYSKQ